MYVKINRYSMGKTSKCKSLVYVTNATMKNDVQELLFNLVPPL